MTGGKTVIKIGGSLLREAPDLLQYIYDRRYLFDGQVIFVPGGGLFAGFIREKEKYLDPGEDAAHWMAILAMEQYGHYLAGKTVVPAITDLRDNSHKISLFLPYGFLLENDPLPHSWDVTSDTIAAMIAVREGAGFIKATDVDGVLKDGKILPLINSPELQAMKATCVDRYLPGYLEKHSLDCFVTGGKHPERILARLQGKKTIGTLIKGNI
jgi:aspartokinase-like uncharacterized kinase